MTHFGLWALAWLVRLKLVRDPGAVADRLFRIARWLDRFGSDVGGMRVMVAGKRADGTQGRNTWYLTARDGDGPMIPCIPAIVIARRLARGESLGSGASPCVGMMTLEEFSDATRDLAITWRIVRE